ncbi:hypothetical protein KPL39_12240 [Clostridium gasigenes]|uniref:hypothetical protein n=1 Tax=Clostridium gasigenes TaxID=94869 RepID=UPI001C0BD61F|nr:hypothetical protein [Clostridium gasigenes]MBU3137035.1 hypothetical protein [Clostridium gasigenes]
MESYPQNVDNFEKRWTTFENRKKSIDTTYMGQNIVCNNMMIFREKYKVNKKGKNQVFGKNILIHKINTMWISSVDNPSIITIIKPN